MPYITQNYRDELIPIIDALTAKIKEINANNPSQTCDGLLNYTITETLNGVYPDPRYRDFNEIMGMLTCCQLEYYRKRAAGYEDVKEQENGKVRTFDKHVDRGY